MATSAWDVPLVHMPQPTPQAAQTAQVALQQPGTTHSPQASATVSWLLLRRSYNKLHIVMWQQQSDILNGIACQVAPGNNSTAWRLGQQSARALATRTTVRDPLLPICSRCVVLCPAGCIPGRQGSDCTVCPVGKVSKGGAASASLTCTACPAGQNTSTTGQDACDLCVAGYAGASCRACPFASYAAGDAAKSGARNCTVCPEGRNTTGTAKGLADDCSGEQRDLAAVCLLGA
jgi:hypothetical protein